jgi:hypothetical protein
MKATDPRLNGYNMKQAAELLAQGTALPESVFTLTTAKMPGPDDFVFVRLKNAKGQVKTAVASATNGKFPSDNSGFTIYAWAEIPETPQGKGA